jgi:tRNA A-37 threonylcarbamoyl transferase component Bud32
MRRLTPGQTLAGGRYTIVRSLSQGGTGAIELAVDHEAFDRPVVIKTLLPPEQPADAAEQQATQERFLREARTLAALRFPTIPRIYSCFQEGGQSFIAMEYIEGTDLSAHLTRADEATGLPVSGRPAPLPSVIRWGVSLCRTLEYLAAREPPVVHQDIKPANLILARDSGELYLVDFGAARARPVALPAGGKTGIFGTPGYAAPEQFQGRSEPRSDVYALAATLYHLATDDDPGAHLFAFPRLGHLGYLGQVLGAALQPDPAARPSATELRVQLEAIQRDEGSRPLRAPDGSVLYAERELSDWCERSWPAAAAWLYGALPERVEADWLRPDLARRLRQWAEPHADAPGRGLDAALAGLDPRGYGAAAPQLHADAAALDLGELLAGEGSAARLTVRNPGRRYVEAALELPAWVEARPSTLALGPGEEATVTFAATRSFSPSRRHHGWLLAGPDAGRLLAVPVEGRPAPARSRPRSPQFQRLALAALLAGWLLVALAVLAAGML